MRAPFVPSNLVKLLGGYARMGHISSTCSSMLDAAAGFVVRRMANGHLNAVTKLSDLSQLLQAYATLGHQTVVMPELLTAASNQVSLYILIRAASPGTSFVWAKVIYCALTHVPAMACCGVATLSGRQLLQSLHHVKVFTMELTCIGKLYWHAMLDTCGTGVSPYEADLQKVHVG